RHLPLQTPAAGRFPTVSASNQMLGEPGFCCNHSLTRLPLLPSSLKNTGSDAPGDIRNDPPDRWRESPVQYAPLLRAGSVCSSTRRTALQLALLIRASVRGQARLLLPSFVRTFFLSGESKTPVSCRFPSAPWQSRPYLLGHAELCLPELVSV